MKKSVVVAATSDESALKRTHAALSATAVAEYFRDQGKDVLLLMDSVTRFAMAQREVGLAVGEPPTSRGYTPSVFGALPRLMERAGLTSSGGSITAFYTVLVEADDMNDPIADHARAILDGHVVLSRALSNQGHFPSISLLESNSRLQHELVDVEARGVAEKVRSCFATHEQYRDMVDLGAYVKGTNAELDYVLRVMPQLMLILKQSLSQREDPLVAMQELKRVLDLGGA